MTDTIRDICPVCDRSMALTKTGRMRRHGAKNDTWPPEDCVGTGQEPKDNTKHKGSRHE